MKQALHAGRVIRCILFDFGDTLWTHNLATYKHADRLARQHMVQTVSTYINPQLFPIADLEEFGLLLDKQLHHEVRLRMRQKIGYEPDFADCTISVLAQFGLPHLDHAAGAAIFEASRVRIPESRTILPDTYTTLAGLQERGYILGVVTNRSHGGVPFQEDMRQIGFDRYFDLSAMAVSADLEIRKPNPDIFLHALKQLDVSPYETVMVGDSLHADIHGANMLDMISIWRAKERIREEARAFSSSTRPATDEQRSDPQNADDIAREKEAVWRHAQKYRKWEYDMPGCDARPDHIIYTLSELLELF
ncbi:MAG TPA: HAD-IA family hydrolase [Ktedonobacteraceae bacterium]|jgi:HAD superfamily hydrolase (TIGR01662 family)